MSTKQPDLALARPARSAVWRSTIDGRLWVSMQLPDGPRVFVPAGSDDVTAAATSGVWLIGEPVFGAPATVVVWGDMVKTTGAVHSERAVVDHDLIELDEDDLPDDGDDELTFRPRWTRWAGAALGVVVLIAIALLVPGLDDVISWEGKPPKAVLAVVLGSVGLPLYLLCRPRIDLDWNGGSAGRFGRRTSWAWGDLVDVQDVGGAVDVVIRNRTLRLPDWPPANGRVRLAAAIMARSVAATGSAETGAWTDTDIPFAAVPDFRSKWRRTRACVWWASAFLAVVLVTATFALGDLVQRDRLRGWVRTTGVVTEAGGDIAADYRVGAEVRTNPMTGWSRNDYTVGDRVEIWYDPATGADVLADDTPLHSLAPAAMVGGPAALALLVVIGLAVRWRRAAIAAARQPDSSAGPDGREAVAWLLAGAVPMAAVLGTLGWLVVNPEADGGTQLGVALLGYLASLFAVHKSLRAEEQRWAEEPGGLRP